MLKKILLVTLACVLCFALISCDSKPSVTVPGINDEPATNTDDTPSSTQKPSTSDKNEGDELSWLNVATYNILHCADLTTSDNHGDAYPDKYVDLIKEYEIDILGMNEVDINCSRSMGAAGSEYRDQYKSNQPKYIAAKLTEQTGEQYYWAFDYSIKNGVDRIPPAHAGDALYGNAIISKYPIVSTRSFKVYCHDYDPSKPNTQFGPSFGGGNQYEVKTVLIAEIDVKGTIVTVISTHYGLGDDERALMTSKLEMALEEIETPVILMGDFNSQPNDANILKLNTLLNVAGGPTNNTATFHKGRRIDYIYTSNNFTMKDYKVLSNVGYSDHYPVTVKVLLNK